MSEAKEIQNCNFQHTCDMWQGVELHIILFGLETLQITINSTYSKENEQENR